MSSQQKCKFNSEQYAMILNFLEDPQNKAKIWGVSGKTEVGVVPPRKIEAWKELVTLINNKFKGNYTLDHKSVAGRWRTYLNKYKIARERSSATGFGIIDLDKKRNIHTVKAKMDSMCPHYERIHALVGERPNVSPAATFDSGSINEGTDLNEVLRFNADDLPNFLDEDTPIAKEDSSGPQDIAPNANEVPIIPHTLVFSNEEVVLSPPSQHKQAMGGPELEDDDIFPSDLEASPMLATSNKRQVKMDNHDPKKSKKDRRKDLPSLIRTKHPTQARNLLALTIQESASAKAAALLTIEEKKLKFEQMKWDTERVEREARCKAEQEENERRQKEDERRRKEDEQRRKEDKEEERKRRAEDKAEKCRERRFALLQAMLADGKSPDEIKEILAMLL